MSDEQPAQESGALQQTPDEVDPGVFTFFSLEGDRFNLPGMPADAGRELAAFRDAIADIAVQLWKRENPDRRRAPNAMSRSFDLRLQRVKPGSVQPQLTLQRPSNGPTDEEWAEWVRYYEQARDLATERFEQVAEQDTVPTGLQREIRIAMAKVGSTLTGEERLRVGRPGSGLRGVVTPRVREVLQQRDPEPEPQERVTSVVGVLKEYDGGEKSFELRTEDGRTVLCLLDQYDPELAERAREYLALDGVTAPDVRVGGQTLETDDARVRRLYNVHTLEVVWTVAEKVIVHRLKGLTALEVGWLGPGSLTATAEQVQALEPVVGTITALGLPVTIVPSGDGAIVLEWRAGAVEYTAELGRDNHLFMCADNVETDELVEREVDYDPEILRRFLREGAME